MNEKEEDEVTSDEDVAPQQSKFIGVVPPQIKVEKIQHAPQVTVEAPQVTLSKYFRSSSVSDVSTLIPFFSAKVLPSWVVYALQR